MADQDSTGTQIAPQRLGSFKLDIDEEFMSSGDEADQKDLQDITGMLGVNQNSMSVCQPSSDTACMHLDGLQMDAFNSPTVTAAMRKQQLSKGLDVVAAAVSAAAYVSLLAWRIEYPFCCVNKSTNCK